MAVLHIQTYISNVISNLTCQTYISNVIFKYIWVISKQFHYASCLSCWALFGKLVPTMCIPTSCVQMHELLWGQWRIANNRGGTLCVFLTTYFLIQHTVLVITIMVLWQLMPLSTFKYTNYKKILKLEPRTWTKDVCSQLFFYMLLD